MSKIVDKAQNYDLYQAGKFGNKLITFPTLDEYYASGFDKDVVLRYKGSNGGADYPSYGLGLKPDAVSEIVAGWLSRGARREFITANELAEDTKLVLQGEVWRSTAGLYLRYTTVPKPMRAALKEQNLHLHGYAALSMLQTYMDPRSLDWLHEMLDEIYPDHVVEFSTYSCDVGCIPRRNTVFWEVRDY